MSLTRPLWRWFAISEFTFEDDKACEELLGCLPMNADGSQVTEFASLHQRKAYYFWWAHRPVCSYCGYRTDLWRAVIQTGVQYECMQCNVFRVKKLKVMSEVEIMNQNQQEEFGRTWESSAPGNPTISANPTRQQVIFHQTCSIFQYIGDRLKGTLHPDAWRASLMIIKVIGLDFLPPKYRLCLKPFSLEDGGVVDPAVVSCVYLATRVFDRNSMCWSAFRHWREVSWQRTQHISKVVLGRSIPPPDWAVVLPALWGEELFKDEGPHGRESSQCGDESPATERISGGEGPRGEENPNGQERCQGERRLSGNIIAALQKALAEDDFYYSIFNDLHQYVPPNVIAAAFAFLQLHQTDDMYDLTHWDKVYPGAFRFALARLDVHNTFDLHVDDFIEDYGVHDSNCDLQGKPPLAKGPLFTYALLKYNHNFQYNASSEDMLAWIKEADALLNQESFEELQNLVSSTSTKPAKSNATAPPATRTNAGTTLSLTGEEQVMSPASKETRIRGKMKEQHQAQELEARFQLVRVQHQQRLAYTLSLGEEAYGEVLVNEKLMRRILVGAELAQELLLVRDGMMVEIQDYLAMPELLGMDRFQFKGVSRLATDLKFLSLRSQKLQLAYKEECRANERASKSQVLHHIWSRLMPVSFILDSYTESELRHQIVLWNQLAILEHKQFCADDLLGFHSHEILIRHLSQQLMKYWQNYDGDGVQVARPTMRKMVLLSSRFCHEVACQLPTMMPLPFCMMATLEAQNVLQTEARWIYRCTQLLDFYFGDRLWQGREDATTVTVHKSWDAVQKLSVAELMKYCIAGKVASDQLLGQCEANFLDLPPETGSKCRQYEAELDQMMSKHLAIQPDTSIAVGSTRKSQNSSYKKTKTKDTKALLFATVLPLLKELLRDRSLCQPAYDLAHCCMGNDIWAHLAARGLAVPIEGKMATYVLKDLCMQLQEDPEFSWFFQPQKGKFVSCGGQAKLAATKGPTRRLVYSIHFLRPAPSASPHPPTTITATTTPALAEPSAGSAILPPGKQSAPLPPAQPAKRRHRVAPAVASSPITDLAVPSAESMDSTVCSNLPASLKTPDKPPDIHADIPIANGSIRLPANKTNALLSAAVLPLLKELLRDHAVCQPATTLAECCTYNDIWAHLKTRGLAVPTDDRVARAVLKDVCKQLQTEAEFSWFFQPQKDKFVSCGGQASLAATRGSARRPVFSIHFLSPALPASPHQPTTPITNTIVTNSPAAATNITTGERSLPSPSAQPAKRRRMAAPAVASSTITDPTVPSPELEDLTTCSGEPGSPQMADKPPDIHADIPIATGSIKLPANKVKDFLSAAVLPLLKELLRDHAVCQPATTLAECCTYNDIWAHLMARGLTVPTDDRVARAVLKEVCKQLQMEAEFSWFFQPQKDKFVSCGGQASLAATRGSAKRPVFSIHFLRPALPASPHQPTAPITNTIVTNSPATVTTAAAAAEISSSKEQYTPSPSAQPAKRRRMAAPAVASSTITDPTVPSPELEDLTTCSDEPGSPQMPRPPIGPILQALMPAAARRSLPPVPEADHNAFPAAGANGSQTKQVFGVSIDNPQLTGRTTSSAVQKMHRTDSVNSPAAVSNFTASSSKDEGSGNVEVRITMPVAKRHLVHEGDKKQPNDAMDAHL